MRRNSTFCKRFWLYAALAGGAVFNNGQGCLPENYWSDLAGSTLSGVVTQVVEDTLSDRLDGVDPE